MSKKTPVVFHCQKHCIFAPVNDGLTMRYSFTIMLNFIFVLYTHAQVNYANNQESNQLHIKRLIGEINVDGLLNEAVWKDAEKANEFWQKSPIAGKKGLSNTEVQVTYDDKYLYVAATCYDSEDMVIYSLKRDLSFWDGESMAIILDPLNEASSGFMFGTSPYGVQTDVLLGGGTGIDNYNGQWDNKWFVETTVHDDRWTVEMAIPFKTLRYSPTQTSWGINFMRNDKKNNRQDIWAPIPDQFWMIDLGYTGQLIWDQAPAKANGNMTIIPFINTSIFKDYTTGESATTSFDVGLDAKIALNSSLNLDLTVNPDFSQVEVDQQVTNLTRFSIFLPERRTFFLENSRLFSQVGFPTVQPFFSRRIGLDENGAAVPILYGARLTGNISPTTQMGILNTQTKSNDTQLGQNYTAATFSQRIFKRSTIQGLFVNRQSYTDGDFSNTDYGRNLSLKFNYVREDGKFEFWSGVHKSIKHEISGSDMFFENGVAYAGRNFSALFDHVFVGTNYFADVGFINMVENYDAERDEVIRLGYHLFVLPISYTFLPSDSKHLNQHSISYEGELNLDPDGKFLERTNAIEYGMEFKNSSQFAINVQEKETELRFPFSFTGKEPLPKGNYQYSEFSIAYDSDERKVLQYDLGFRHGGFYNGKITSAEFGFNYRRQPWGNFGLAIEYNNLKFPDPYGETNLWAITPRVELSFSRNLFWTIFMQYNTQADNFNINSRFQWRFSPMSDIFLVYTDNYAVENFGVKNRAIVLKASYWFVR